MFTPLMSLIVKTLTLNAGISGLNQDSYQRETLHSPRGVPRPLSIGTVGERCIDIFNLPTNHLTVPASIHGENSSNKPKPKLTLTKGGGGSF